MEYPTIPVTEPPEIILLPLLEKLEKKLPEIQSFGIKFDSKQKSKAIERFQKKRRERKFSKNVRYERRQTLAIQRPRYKGRFIKPETLKQIQILEEEFVDDKFYCSRKF
jgi:hypothetical protein